MHRSSGHAISQLLSRKKSVVSAHALVARSVASGGHSHSCGMRTQVLIDLFDTVLAIGMYAFHRSCHISFSVTKDVCCKALNFVVVFFLIKTFGLFQDYFWGFRERVVALR